MKKTEDEFDEAILDSEDEFNKRFKPIKRPKFVDSAIKKALKESKNRITIYLDADIIEHFKAEAERSKLGYQTLINQALREMLDNPKNNRTVDEVIEKLLKDKDALSKLKARLKTV